MEYLVSYYTDKGIRKSTNQDSLVMKTLRTAKGRIGLFSVCDGMGGLEDGELASATVIDKISQWFNDEVPNMINETSESIVESLNSTIIKVNKSIVEYASKNSIRLGSTITAFLCVFDKYYIIQVGDSRAYKINDSVELLTKDQTYVAREVERGNLTEDESKIHPKRNILLQCVGVNMEMEPIITEGEIENEAMYVICSDGLHHKLSDLEMKKFFNPHTNYNEDTMSKTAKDVVELVMRRKETDNITVLLVKTK